MIDRENYKQLIRLPGTDNIPTAEQILAKRAEKEKNKESGEPSCFLRIKRNKKAKIAWVLVSVALLLGGGVIAGAAKLVSRDEPTEAVKETPEAKEYGETEFYLDRKSVRGLFLKDEELWKGSYDDEKHYGIFLFRNWEEYQAWAIKTLKAGTALTELLTGCDETYFADNILLLCQHAVSLDAPLTSKVFMNISPSGQSARICFDDSNKKDSGTEDYCSRIDIPLEYLEGVSLLEILIRGTEYQKAFPLVHVQKEDQQKEKIALKDDIRVSYALWPDRVPVSEQNIELYSDREQLPDWLQEQEKTPNGNGNGAGLPKWSGERSAPYSKEFFENHVLLLLYTVNAVRSVHEFDTDLYKNGTAAELILSDKFEGWAADVISRECILIEIPREYLDGIKKIDVTYVKFGEYARIFSVSIPDAV